MFSIRLFDIELVIIWLFVLICFFFNLDFIGEVENVCYWLSVVRIGLIYWFYVILRNVVICFMTNINKVILFRFLDIEV